MAHCECAWDGSGMSPSSTEPLFSDLAAAAAGKAFSPVRSESFAGVQEGCLGWEWGGGQRGQAAQPQSSALLQVPAKLSAHQVEPSPGSLFCKQLFALLFPMSLAKTERTQPVILGSSGVT